MATIETSLHRRVLRIADTPQETIRWLADTLASWMAEKLSQASHCTLALAGGNTPRALYQLLATEYRDKIPWTRVHLFWGDERYVPHDHANSNFRLAYETLITPLNLPPTQIHPMPTHLPNPDEAAAQYERHLRQFFGEYPVFDLVLLGMGTDGHVASLFPQTEALQEVQRWVAVGKAPSAPHTRLTLTLPVLNQARRVYLLVTGADKAPTVRQALVENAPLPVNLVSPQGELVWWLDQQAASGIREIIDVQTLPDTT